MFRMHSPIWPNILDDQHLSDMDKADAENDRDAEQALRAVSHSWAAFQIHEYGDEKHYQLGPLVIKMYRYISMGGTCDFESEVRYSIKKDHFFEDRDLYLEFMKWSRLHNNYSYWYRMTADKAEIQESINDKKPLQNTTKINFPLIDLPPDVLRIIMSKLSIETLSALMSTCTKLHSVIEHDSNTFWLNYTLQHIFILKHANQRKLQWLIKRCAANNVPIAHIKTTDVLQSLNADINIFSAPEMKNNQVLLDTIYNYIKTIYYFNSYRSVVHMNKDFHYLPWAVFCNKFDDVVSYTNPSPYSDTFLNSSKKVDDNKLRSEDMGLLAAAICGNLNITKLLLARKANPNCRRSDKWTPLMLAVTQGHTEVACLLLSRGARIHDTLPNGENAIYLAASMGNLELVKRLHEAKADINSKLINGVTPLFIAAQSGFKDVVAYLLRNQANPATLALFNKPRLTIFANTCAPPIRDNLHHFINESSDELVTVLPQRMAALMQHDEIAELISQYCQDQCRPLYMR